MNRPHAATLTATTIRAIVPGLTWIPPSQLEEDRAGVPREDEVETRPPEEHAEDAQQREADHVEGEDRDRDFAIVGPRRGVPVDVGPREHHDDDHGGDRDSGDLRVEVTQQLLQTEEVPRRLG